MQKILLLGYGFVAYHLKKKLEKYNYSIFVSTRNPKENNYIKETDNSIIFDLNDESTYNNIPDNCIIICFFSLNNLEKTKKLYDVVKNKNSIIKIILSTTSLYKDKTGFITENSELDLTLDRTLSELYLNEKQSNILHLSGIWGEEKNPFNWLNKGLIKNCYKTVNLIHIKDIVNVLLLLLESNMSSERFNLSDGKKYLWKDIWSYGITKSFVNVSCPEKGFNEEKFISNDKIKKLLGQDYIFKNLYE
ncbi:MAG: hypothetical protein AABZ74_09800 [Cyanobacteriota bacterium]